MAGARARPPRTCFVLRSALADKRCRPPIVLLRDRFQVSSYVLVRCWRADTSPLGSRCEASLGAAVDRSVELAQLAVFAQHDVCQLPRHARFFVAARGMQDSAYARMARNQHASHRYLRSGSLQADGLSRLCRFASLRLTDVPRFASLWRNAPCGYSRAS